MNFMCEVISWLHRYPWLRPYNPQIDWETGQTIRKDHHSDDGLNDSEHDDTRSQTSTEEGKDMRGRTPPFPKEPDTNMTKAESSISDE
ncbi:hypothetical protein FOPG_20040 [Fusarium oxysporum f. sp. conglutinans race 2 54008]|uniref:Uncharacterized protein n=2 Tax=Fusarium oxysporum TaxID=5507 RepID=X0KFY5_FUSOX|nr:hypothetical protein FOPG_20040 [Fusarium oxysporum f. sp. conglutinans race 2 54008]EXM12413.1 hypothetical protein FOTG_19087 [Fusarium oxysporum f. sp. vasinfectum 25433]